MRNFINIMETIGDESIVDHIAGMVRMGEHEGYGPYWKLKADPRILEDGAAMLHISELIGSGFTSGHHPTWDLTLIDKSDAGITADGEDVGAVEDRMAAKHPELDEEEIEEGKKKHKVVPVHQKMGAGMGWWECPDEHAELFVVEDEHGEPVADGSYADRNSADAHCHHLNTGEEILDEVDIDPTDIDPNSPEGQEMVNANPHLFDLHPTVYSDAPDHEVEVAAIHERGHQQDQAFDELRNRGIELTPDQLAHAGR